MRFIELNLLNYDYPVCVNITAIDCFYIDAPPLADIYDIVYEWAGAVQHERYNTLEKAQARYTEVMNLVKEYKK